MFRYYIRNLKFKKITTRGELADAKSTTDKVEDVRGRRGWKRIFSSLGKFSSETSRDCHRFVNPHGLQVQVGTGAGTG